MEDLLFELAKIGPVVAVLVAAVFYFYKREKSKDEQIQKLHDELRESEKENLTALHKLLAYLEKSDITEDSNHKELLNEIKSMRSSIEDKLKLLNNERQG